MVAKVHALGRSFAGVAAYCLHDAPERDEGERPETAERVEWADTRNLASRPERAAAQMAATAKAAQREGEQAGGMGSGSGGRRRGRACRVEVRAGFVSRRRRAAGVSGCRRRRPRWGRGSRPRSDPVSIHLGNRRGPGCTSSRAIPPDRFRIELIGWHQPVVTFFHDLDLAGLQGQLE